MYSATFGDEEKTELKLDDDDELPNLWVVFKYFVRSPVDLFFFLESRPMVCSLPVGLNKYVISKLLPGPHVQFKWAKNSWTIRSLVSNSFFYCFIKT